MAFKEFRKFSHNEFLPSSTIWSTKDLPWFEMMTFFQVEFPAIFAANY